jgi:hypothetical protein
MQRDRRQNFRVEWKSPASVDLGDGTPRIGCVVKNLSNGGARIACAEALPDEFILRVTPGRGRPRSCRVAWRRGDEIGVRFIDVMAPEATPQKARLVEVIG